MRDARGDTKVETEWGHIEVVQEMEDDEPRALVYLHTRYDTGNERLDIPGLELTLGIQEYTVRASAILTPAQVREVIAGLEWAIRPVGDRHDSEVP